MHNFKTSDRICLNQPQFFEMQWKKGNLLRVIFLEVIFQQKKADV